MSLLVLQRGREASLRSSDRESSVEESPSNRGRETWRDDRNRVKLLDLKLDWQKVLKNLGKTRNGG